MRKEKFIYNTHTLRYEKVEESNGTRALRIFGFVCAAVFTAFIFTLIAHRYTTSPKEKALLKEIKELNKEVKSYAIAFDQIDKELDLLHQRDAYAHRMIFGMDPIDDNIWTGGTGGHDQYEKYRKMKNSGYLLAAVTEKMQNLKWKMVLQSKSLDTIMNMANEKESMLASIPSIKPVSSDKLARRVNLLSGFGRRIHPIYKVPKMHYGIDFTAPQGTAIQATGAGKVVRVENRRTGYGKNVVIDHGFGYKTLYAHMSRVDVREGQEVTRGHKIGLVGSTGTSTAAHCHYEVHYMGKKVNPIHYCMDQLSAQEYEELVKASTVSNQSFD